METHVCNAIMRLDTLKLKTLREKRSWTQEHLAQASGLSLRTIQRLEKDGLASAESRLALAAALEVELSELELLPAPAGDAGRPKARSPELGRFRRHLIIYFVFSAFFLFLDLRPDGRLDWAQWPMMGWGIGVFFQALKVLVPKEKD